MNEFHDENELFSPPVWQRYLTNIVVPVGKVKNSETKPSIPAGISIVLLLLNAVGAAIFFDGATATTIASIPISIAIALKMKSWVSKGDNDSHPNKGKYSFWVDYEAVYNNTLLQQHLSKSVSAHPVSYTHLTLPTNREV